MYSTMCLLKRELIVNAIFLLLGLTSLAQKPCVDTSQFDHWPAVSNPGISNDGKYIFYTIENLPKGNTLVVRSVNGEWEKKYFNSSNAKFSSNSRFLIFNKHSDTLAVLDMLQGHLTYVSNCNSYQIVPKEQQNELLAYSLNTPDNELTLRDINSGVQKTFFNVRDYLFSSDGRFLLLQQVVTKSDSGKYVINLVNLNDRKIKTIWENSIPASNLIFDGNGSQIAFIGTKNSQQSELSIWYYMPEFEKATVLVDNNAHAIDSSLSISGSGLKFSKDNQKVFFYLQNVSVPELNKESPSVDIWSDKDEKLQSLQLNELLKKKKYLAIYNLKSRILFRLQHEDEELLDQVEEIQYDAVLIVQRKGDDWERNWNQASKESVFIVSLRDGSRKLLKENISLAYFTFKTSPGGKYVVMFDKRSKKYFSYEIESGTVRNITTKIPIPLNVSLADKDYPESTDYPYGIAGWFEKDKALLLYDEYDIWQVDLTAKELPINITNSFGRKNLIKFRITEQGNKLRNIPYQKTIPLLLCAFNTVNKDNGYYSVNLNEASSPKRLTMGPYIFYWPSVGGSKPIKARDAEAYIVSRQSCSESQNLFFTNDFLNFNEVSSIYPEREYNWMYSELVQWKTLNQKFSQGVLYKPENFDPQKKYPVIFYYYEILSDRKNLYQKPIYSDGLLNISYLVSNGYLVFTPDIHFETGRLGQSISNSLISAVEYLSKYPWIDSKRIGIQGHSFGGYETNYIITQTNRFAAAASASGLSNLVSSYGSLVYGGRSGQMYAEISQFRIGTTLWNNPRAFIESSPVFSANKVTTPLLMMNNKGDNAVPWQQGLEYFTALRRLEKKVWMLQYDNGEHQIYKGNDPIDFTIRMQQFFDHYLKSAPAPIWMTQGIPARLKQIETGYAYDPSGNCGKDCKVCKYWNEKMKKDSVACWKEINERKEKEHWQ